MKKQLVATLILFIFPFLFVACVSSILKESPPTFSDEIQVTAPQSPFQRTQTSVYPSWKNQKTGNVISIVSDCNANLNLSLPQLHRLVEDSLTQVKLIEETNGTLVDKPTLTRHINAELDGIPIEIISTSFKKNNCGYVSSLSGKIGQIKQDLTTFEAFNKSLKFE